MIKIKYYMLHFERKMYDNFNRSSYVRGVLWRAIIVTKRLRSNVYFP